MGASQACTLALDFDAASSEPSLGGSGFCMKHAGPPAVFCDDFDVDALGTKWPAVEQKNGSAKNDSGASTSAPNSLLSIASPVGVGGSVRAAAVLNLAKLKSTKVGLRISFNLRVEQFDATSGATNVAFAFLYGPLVDYNQVVLNLVSNESAASLRVVEYAPVTAGYALHGPFTTKPAVGQWMKVQIDIDIVNPVGSGNALRVRLNDAVELDTQLQVPLKGDVPRLELGVSWVESLKATQTWAVRYDDFLVETVSL